MPKITLEEWVAQFPRLHAESRALWKAIRWSFEEQGWPMTVRQMFYQMSVKEEVPKSEPGYRKVQYALTQMRRKEAIPYDWTTDSSRYVIKQASYGSLASALKEWQVSYRRDLWAHQDVHVQIWLEKLALAGVFQEVTDRWNVPLFPARGYSSISFVHDIAVQLRTIEKPIFVYHFGDYDPSGQDAPRAIQKELKTHGIECTFIRAAVRPEQVQYWNLPTRETKKSDPRAKNWRGPSVELDAIPPATLRRLIDECISQHVDYHQLAMIEQIEQHEREILQRLAVNYAD